MAVAAAGSAEKMEENTDADGPWHALMVERIITLDLDAIQPDRGSTKSARPHSGVRPSVGIINMTCLFSVDSMRDVDGTERVCLSGR